MSRLAVMTLDRIDELIVKAGGWTPLSAETSLCSSVIWRARKNLAVGRTAGVRLDFLSKLATPYGLIPVALYQEGSLLSFGSEPPFSPGYIPSFFRHLLSTPNMTVRETGEALSIPYSSLHQYAYTRLKPSLGRIEEAANALGFEVEALTINHK